MAAVAHHLESPNGIGAIRSLLHSLAPRADCFCVYDLSCRCIWSSDGAEDHEVGAYVHDLGSALSDETCERGNSLRRTLRSGRTLLTLPVGRNGGEAIAVLVAVFSKNAGKSASYDPARLTETLAPAVDALAAILVLDQELGRAEERSRRIEDELKLIYSVDRKLHDSARRHAGLAELIGHSGRFLGIGYSVLLLPAKRIRISATHSSWKSVNRRAVDKYVIETLFPQLDGGPGPVVFDVPAIEGSEQPIDQGYQVLLSPLSDPRGNVEGVIAQFGRICGRPFDERHKRFMAHIVRKVENVIERSFDPMTGLMNRSGFEAQLRESAKTLGSATPAHQIVYFDLDNLQLVNDSCGHEAGDQVLTRFARLLETSLPRNAVASRLTGDDFAILMTQATLDDALELANAVRSRSDQMRYLHGSDSLQVTVSTGIAAFADGGSEAEALTAARIACDAAKDHGRDRIEVHDQDDQSIIRRYDDMHLVTEIQRSLDRDEFTLLAQPIVDAQRPRRTPRYEILIRMNDGKGGCIPSQSLISAAERYQLMPQIDRWVTSSTIRAIAPHAEDLGAKGLSFAINLSGQTMGDDEMLAFIEQEIDNAGLPARLLSFEITESAAVSNVAKAQTFIARLRERGCRFALDDFGAGLSSFAYLKNLDVQTLKIDGSFIRGILDDRISQSMVAAITQVAKVMELETVAEYVETAECRELLQSLGVHYVQGHAVGMPVELSAVLADLCDERKSA